MLPSEKYLRESFSDLSPDWYEEFVRLAFELGLVPKYREQYKQLFTFDWEYMNAVHRVRAKDYKERVLSLKKPRKYVPPTSYYNLSIPFEQEY